jgi:hypothetical protein
MNGRSSLYLADAGSSREERRDDLLSIGRWRLRPAATVPPAFPVPVRVLRAFVHGPVVELDCEGDRVVDVLGRGVAEIEALDGVHGGADLREAVVNDEHVVDASCMNGDRQSATLRCLFVVKC